jgi:hypothetical protein
MHIMERINEKRRPTTTAEEEFQKLSGSEGDDDFNKAFPPEKTQTEMEEAMEWSTYFKENESQMIAEMAISETMEKSKMQRVYFLGAVNYLEESLKARRIPQNAKFSNIFYYINTEAGKLVSQAHAVERPYTIGVLCTLKALIDLKQDEIDENITLLAVIKELNARLEILNKALKAGGVDNL